MRVAAAVRWADAPPSATRAASATRPVGPRKGHAHHDSSSLDPGTGSGAIAIRSQVDHCSADIGGVTSPVPAERGERSFDAVNEIARRLVANLETVVHGKSEEIRLVLSALVAGGHVLLEDVPGTAKTILARAIAGSVEDIEFSRIQCTPDLQPTDATGLSIFDQERRSFVFQPGPALRERRARRRDQPRDAEDPVGPARGDGRAPDHGGRDHAAAPDPFLLIATENPIEYEGTFPLPEAQLDRFFLRATLGYPGQEAEIQVVREQRHGHPLDRLAPVVEPPS